MLAMNRTFISAEPSQKAGERLEENGHTTRVRAYLERAVHPSLAPFVVCTWVDPATERHHPVLPDGCIDIVWDGRRLNIAGPDTQPSPIASHASFTGIRFKPGAAPGYLGVAASELVDRSVPLVELWGRSASELEERLAESPASAPRLLEDALRGRQHAAVDPLVRQMLRELSPRDGRAPTVTSLARRLDVSERTLLRRCASAIGYGPKTLERILRFRRALRLITSKVPLVDTAQLAGYVDQTHLTHEFQRLAGAAPGQLTRSAEIVISSNGYP
jgi:AraC-like DNA-binding protein